MTDDPRATPQPQQGPNHARVATQATATAAPAPADVLQRSCSRITANFRETLGADGCAALLSRAIARLGSQHTALEAMWRQDGREIYLDGIVAATERHGYPAVAAAAEALTIALVDVLGRLIGDDMAIRIIDLGADPAERIQGTR